MSALLVLVVGPEGWAEPLWVERGEFLPECQALVGGLVDVVSVASSVDAWVNDEGLFVCEPNPVATLLVWSIRGFASPESMGPALFGRVVFTGGADGEGDTQGLSQGQAEALQKAASGLAVDAGLATVPVSRVRDALAGYQREFQ